MRKYFLLAVCVGLSARMQVRAQESHSVRIQPTDVETSMAVEGVEVLIFETGFTGSTNSAGHLTVNLNSGLYRIKFFRLGYAEQTIHVRVQSDTTLIPFIKPTPYQLAQVNIRSTAVESEFKNSAINTTVLDRAFLEANYHSTFSQGIEKVPGINSITTGVGIAKPVIRGLQGNRITVNNHGIRQEGQQWGSDHGLEIDPFGVDRVEIIRGAASLMYGSDALGGVINITEPLIPQRGTYRADLIGVYRNNNDHFGSSLAFTTRQKDCFFSIRTTLQSYGDYRVPADEFEYNGFVLPIENRRLKNTAGSEKHLAMTVGKVLKTGSVSLSVSNYNQTTGLFPGAVGIPRSYRLLHDGDFRNSDLPRQEINHFKTALNSKLQVGAGRLDTDIGFQYNNRQEKSFPHVHGQGITPAGNLALGLDLFTGTMNSRYHLNINEKINLSAGITGQVQENSRAGFEFLLGDFMTLQGGMYVFGKVHLSDVLTLNIGARLDAARVASDAHFQPVYASPDEIVGEVQRGEAISRNFSQPSGAVGISWSPEQNFNIKLNAGRTFRFPSAPEMLMNGVHHGTFRHEVGKADLRPETGWQFDAGVYWDFPTVLLSFTPFFNYFDNYIFLRPTALFSPLPEAGQLYEYTEAEALHTGGEFQVVWNPGQRFTVESSVEYLYNVNLNNNLPLPFTPPLLSRSELRWHLKRGRTKSPYVFAEMVVSAGQQRVDRNEKSTPAYQIANTGFAVTKQTGRVEFQLQIAVRNIADTPYLLHLSRYRLLNLPEPGRNAMVTLRMSLM